MLMQPRNFRCLGRASTSYVMNQRLQQRRNITELPNYITPFFTYASDCYITTGIQNFMDVMHTSGMPWAATFMATGLALRLVTAPAHIYAEKLFAKRMHATNYIHQSVLQKVGQHYGVKVVPNEDHTQLVLNTNDEFIKNKSEQLSAETTSAYILENKLQATRIQNLKMFTVPVWICSSFAIRNIVGGDFAPTVHGALWVPDLLLPDPYLVLPFLVGVFGFANLFLQRFVYPVKAPTWQMRSYDIGLAFFTLAAIRIMIDLPACIPLYWLVVSVSGMLQNMFIRHPRVKSWFGIPRLPTDSSTPLRDFFLMRRPRVR